jgi:hypothetical protein
MSDPQYIRQIHVDVSPLDYDDLRDWEDALVAAIDRGEYKIVGHRSPGSGDLDMVRLDELD